jgi:hypothetical protein
MGKFGFIFREACEWAHVFQDGVHRVSKENWQSRLDGIEVCSEYITPLQRYLYDEIFIGPAQEIVARLGNYDVIHLGDVIEHFEKSEGQRLLDILFEKAKVGVLIVTPIGEYQQQGTEQNPYEEHKSVWSSADLCRFPYVWPRKVAKRQWVMFISREPHGFSDPFGTRGKTARQYERSNARRQKVKELCRGLFGEKCLAFMVRVKRRLEGWRTKD